jgi:hypothetical protein
VVGGDLDEDDADAVRVLDPHLVEAPGLGHWLAQHPDTRRGKALVFGADVTHLEPEHYRAPWAALRAAGHLQEPRAEEEDKPGVGRRAELPVDGKAEHIAVEAAAPVQVRWPQQDPAAQDLHATIMRITQTASRRR